MCIRSVGAFDMERIPPELASLFEEAGVTKDQLQNPETVLCLSEASQCALQSHFGCWGRHKTGPSWMQLAPD